MADGVGVEVGRERRREFLVPGDPGAGWWVTHSLEYRTVHESSQFWGLSRVRLGRQADWDGERCKDAGAREMPRVPAALTGWTGKIGEAVGVDSQLGHCTLVSMW
jgi:hypothetical protein